MCFLLFGPNVCLLHIIAYIVVKLRIIQISRLIFILHLFTCSEQQKIYKT
jgi:hypothetical protein